MSGSFYRAFEDRHRGSRELISERQQVYLPFIKPLQELVENCPALDLGCGRGEWLEILLSAGFNAQGVDLDAGMLDACTERGLPAIQSGALEFLASLPDNSQGVVSGFHIAEHIPFPDLQIMVAEALRVLMPGGILILETPNAENLVVGTNSFYLDPTHERPIPHLLLSFLTEHTGFHRSKLMRLQEPAQLHDEDYPIDLMAVFAGASPDYAIVAQKSADQEILARFDEAYDKIYGLALEELAKRYDSALTRNITELRMQVEKQGVHGASMEGQLSEFKHRSYALEARTLQIEAIADQLRHQLQDSAIRAIRAEARAQEMELTLREGYRHTANVEARLAVADSSNDTLREQLQQTSQELFQQRKDLQRLEVTLELERERQINAMSLVASAQAELSNSESSESASSADEQARLAQLEGLVAEIESLRSSIAQVESERANAFLSFAEVEAHAKDLHAQLNNSLSHAHSLQTQLDDSTSRAAVLQDQLNDSLGNAHHWYLQALGYEQRLKAVLKSSSWRVTSPLRLVFGAIYTTVKFPALAFKKVARGVANRLVNFVIARPKLAVKLGNVSRKMPKVHARLSRIARAEDHSSAPVDIGPKNATAELAVGSVSQSGQQPVTHRASAIYHALESSVESKVKH